MYVQPFESQLPTPGLLPFADAEENVLSATGGLPSATPNAGDAIARLVPPSMNPGILTGPTGATNALWPFSGMLQQIIQMLQSMMG